MATPFIVFCQGNDSLEDHWPLNERSVLFYELACVGEGGILALDSGVCLYVWWDIVGSGGISGKTRVRLA
jgi:hypothetical protein